MQEKDVIIERIKRSGVVGAGGSGFPTHIKASAKASIIIANGCECEPLVEKDKFIMQTFPNEIIKGIKILMFTTGAEKAVIVLKKKYKEAIFNLRACIRKEDSITIKELDDFYPAGDEHALVIEVLGKVIPEGGIPIHQNTLVQNVETLKNIYHAVYENKPVTHKYVNIAGEIENPQIVHCPVGTKAKDLIEKCGKITTKEYIIIEGGPLMGKIVSEQEPVKKTTSTFIVLPKNHTLAQRKSLTINAQIKKAKSACDGCRLCTDYCPRYLNGHNLQPHEAMRTLASDETLPSSYSTASFLCCFCGVCELVCPCQLSPKSIYFELKNEFSNHEFKNPHNNSPKFPREEREARKLPKNRILDMLDLNKYVR